MASSASDGAMSGLFQNANYWDYAVNPLTRYGYSQYWNDAGRNQLYWSQQAADYSSALQYKYAQAYAENAPSWNRAGLEKAGYNPILAATGGNLTNVTTPSVPMNGQTINQSGGKASTTPTAINMNRILASEADTAESEAKMVRSQIEPTIAESAAREAEALQRQQIADAYNCAIQGIEPADSGGRSSMFWNMVERFKNKAERDRYVDSIEHQVYEDIREGVSSAADLTRAGAAVKSAIKKSPEITEKHVYHYNRRH